MVKNYTELNSLDKNKIVEYYYNFKDIRIKNISNMLNISYRAVRRVLKEAGINTRLKNRYVLDENYFDCIDTEAKAYILGFIYADGFVGNDRFNNIVISINDREILEFISKEFKFSGEIRTTKKGGFKNSKSGYSINFSSKIMASRLREIGLYPNKSLTLEKMPCIDEKLIRHFIRGYFDGDGSIVLSHNTSYYKAKGGTIKYIYPTYCFMILGTENFLNDILEKTKFKHAKIYDTRSEKMKCLKINAKKEYENVFNYLYNNSTIKLERKYNKWNEIKSAFIAGAIKQIG